MTVAGESRPSSAGMQVMSPRRRASSPVGPGGPDDEVGHKAALVSGAVVTGCGVKERRGRRGLFFPVFSMMDIHLGLNP